MPEQDPAARRRHHRRWPAVVSALAAGALAVAAYHLASGADRPSPAGAATSAPVPRAAALPAEVRGPARPGAPERLRLPTLGVDAPVVPVRAPARTLVPPRDPAVLGWWADGVRPSSPRGSVLIAGHTVHGAARGALDDLGALRAGDPVVVATDRGRVRYVVTRVRTFGKGALARSAARLFRQEGPPRLALVTCADWDGRTFRSNVVVLARPAA